MKKQLLTFVALLLITLSSFAQTGNLLYGVAKGSTSYGIPGVIFHYDIAANTQTVDYTFSGEGPYGSLVQNGTKFYGMNYSGGANGLGMLFEWNTANSTFTKKIDFTGALNGAHPMGSLTLKDGKYYGMTQTGGANDMGTIFEWDPITNVLTKKVDFDGTNKGSWPNGDLTLDNGVFYGMTSDGGTLPGGYGNGGVIFKWNPTTEVFTKLFNFGWDDMGTPSFYADDINYGEMPYGSITVYNGKLYGMTTNGGYNDGETSAGVIFEYDLTTNIYTRKVKFDQSDVTTYGHQMGHIPYGSLALYNGKFYGTTFAGGSASAGVVFKWDPSTNTYTEIQDMDGSTVMGYQPKGTMAVCNGLLYGMTSNSFNSDAGELFTVNPSTNAYAEIYGFDGSANHGGLPERTQLTVYNTNPVWDVTQNTYFSTIQAAINAATAGDVINVAAGTYYEEVLISGKTNLTLTGAGEGSTIIAPVRAFALNNSGISLYNSNSITIQNLTIDGFANAGLATGVAHFKDGIHFGNNASPESNVGGNSCIFTHVTIQNVDRRGISVFPETLTDNQITYCTINNVTGVNNGQGYAQGVQFSGSGLIEHCNISNVTGALLGNCNVVGGTLSIQDNVITDLTGLTATPFDIGINFWCKQSNVITVKNNSITANVENNNGIYIVRGGDGSEISNNTINLTGIGGAGIETGWENTWGFPIHHNTITMGKGAAGIIVTGAGSDADPMLIYNNTLTNVGSDDLFTNSYIDYPLREVGLLLSGNKMTSRTRDATYSFNGRVYNNSIDGFKDGIVLVNQAYAVGGFTDVEIKYSDKNSIINYETAARYGSISYTTPYAFTEIASGNANYAQQDLTMNYWGSASPDFATIIDGKINYCPYYTNSIKTILGPVVNTNTGVGYCTIQAAINAATAGDVINVAAGTYAENVNITKSITLNGAKVGVDARTRTFTGESILDGTGLPSSTYDGIKIANGVSNVTIDGFEIRNYAGSGSNGDGNAISSYCMSSNTSGSTNVTVQNNYMHDLAYNGVLVGSENNTSTDMVVQSGWIIQKNKLSGFKYAGIELTNVINSQVKDNLIAAPTTIFDDPGDAGVAIEIAARSRGKQVTAGTNNIVSGNTITGTFPTGSRAAINVLARSYLTGVSNATLTGLTISGNTISGATNVRSAILLVSESRNGSPSTISSVAIENNVLDGNSDGIVIQDYLNSTGTPTHSGITISGNDIKNNTGVGLHILSATAATGITTTENSFLANTLFGIKNEGTGTLSASCNWFGSALVSEIAAKISGSATYIPYSVSLGGACSGAPVTNVTQSTYYSVIQTAIDAANANDVINVTAGTYAESLSIGKSLTILGPNATQTPNSGTRATEAVIMPNTLAPAISATANNITVSIKGLKFDMSNAAINIGAELGSKFFVVSGATNQTWTFEHNIYTHYKGHYYGEWLIDGISTNALFNIWDNYFTANHCDGGFSNGIMVPEPASVGHETNIDVRDNVWIDNAGYAMNLNSVHGTISGNIIKNTAFVSSPDLQEPNVNENQLGLCLAASNNDLLIQNNTFQLLARPGVVLFNSPAFAGTLSVTNNLFTDIPNNAGRGAFYPAVGSDVSNVSLSGNSFVNNTNNIKNNASTALNATCNWWGTTNITDITSKFKGTAAVNYSPYEDADNGTCVGGPVYVSHLGSIVSSHATIQGAIAAAQAGDVITAAGTYTEIGQIVIDKNLTLIGADKATTIIKPAQNTGSVDDARGWFIVRPGVTFNLSKVTLNGTGMLTYDAIQQQGNGTIDDCIFTEIKYNASGPDYKGAGVRKTGAGTVNVTNCQFSQMGRNGVIYINGGTGTVSGNTYTGKGTGDWLDYAFDAEYGGMMTVNNNQISNNLGIATVDGSGSAAVTVWDDPNVGATFTNNTFTNNSIGVAVAMYGGTTPQVVIGDGNLFDGGEMGLDLQKMAASGTPNLTFAGVSTFKGQTSAAIQIQDGISAGSVFDISNVVFKTSGGTIITDNYAKEDLVIHAIDASNRGLFVWNANNLYVTENSFVAPATTTPSIQRAIGVASNGNTVNVGEGTYAEHITINKSISLLGANKTTTLIDGTNTGIVATLTANNATFKNFTVKNSGTDQDNNAGIVLYGVSGCTVDNNIATDNITGIALFNSNTNTVSNNTISSSALYGLWIGNDALTSSTNTVTGNTITSSGRDGLYADKNCNGNTITNNSISGTIGTTNSDGFEGNGIYFWKSGTNTVTGNTITGNATNGIEMMGSGSDVITNNTITGNDIGLLIRRSNSFSFASHTISGNNISGNTTFGINTDFTGADPIINASCNWWGSAVASTVAAEIGSHVTNSPYNVSLGGACTGSPIAIASATPDHITCGESTGSIAVAFSGGTANYSFAWSGGGSASAITTSPYTITGLAAGDYTITITDANGSTATSSATILRKTVANTTNSTYYSTIQSAITAASAGDVITVCAGTYTENISIDKSLTLRSAAGTWDVPVEQQTIFTGAVATAKISFSNCSNVTIDGFLFTGIDNGPQQNVIYSSYTDHVTMSDNKFDNFEHLAIEVTGCSDWTVSGNTFNDIHGASTLGEAIYFSSVPNVTVSDNIFTNLNYAALQFDGSSSNATITGNTFTNIVNQGINFGKMNGAIISNNTMTNCNSANDGRGAIRIYPGNSTEGVIGDITISSNTISNTGGTNLGNAIVVKPTGNAMLANVSVTNNNFAGNAFGINYTWVSGGTSISATNNYWGNNGPKTPSGTIYVTNSGSQASANVSVIPWWCDVSMSTVCPQLDPGNAIMNTNTGVQYTPAQLATALVAAAGSGYVQTLYIAEGTVEGAIYDEIGKTVNIIGTGIPGQSLLEGHSPALTISNGSLTIQNGVTFYNSTDFPTILVDGTGSLEIRNCIIHETPNGDRACIKVDGADATVDAGTTASHGNNNFIVHGLGSAIDITTSTLYTTAGSPVVLSAEYNDWGSAKGPLVSTNSNGNGAAILPYADNYPTYGVDYNPWGGGPITTIAPVSICAGATTVDIPVKVSNLNNVGGFSLTIAYDVAKLSTPTIANRNAAFGLTATPWDAFTLGIPVAGQYRIAGFGATAADGISLDDGSTLFTLRFNVLASATTTTLSFVENTQGTGCEFTGLAPEYPPYGDMPTASNYVNGDVTVNSLPTITTTGTAAPICFNASSQTTTLAYSATTNSPTTYSIDWNGTANTAGLSDQSSTAFNGTSPITGILIPAGLVASTYSGTMTITNANGCTNTQAISVQVDAQSVAAAGSDQTLCNTATFTMAAVPTVGTGAWTFVGEHGTAAITAPTSATTSITTVPVNTNITLRWTETNGTCNSSTDDVVIRNDQQPVAAAGPDQTLCNTTTFTMAAVPTVGTGAWTFVGSYGTAVITTASSAITTITTVPVNTNITLRWTETNGTCSDYNDVVIRNDAAVTVADAGNATADANCDAKTFVLGGNTALVGTGTWTASPSSGVSFSNANNPIATVTVPNWEAYTFTWTIVNGTCSTSDNTVVTFYEQVTTADAGIDQAKCATETFTLAGNTATVGVGTWTKISGAGSITSLNSATSGVTGVTAGQSTVLRWTIVNGTCSSYDEVTLINDEQSVAAAGADQTLCNTATFTMAAVPTVGTGAWTFVGTHGTAAITAPTSATTTITTMPFNTNITLRWTETNGTCSSTDDVVIRNDEQSVAAAGADQTLCNTATFTMAAVPTVGTGAWTFVGANGTAAITAPTSATTTITTVPFNTNITLRWTETNGACSSTDDVVIRNDEQSVAAAGADQTLCNTATFTMAAVPTVGTGAWTFVGAHGTAAITVPTSATTTITTVPVNTNITLRWTETNGTCSSTDDVVIRNDEQSVAAAGADQALCNTATFTMAAVPTVGAGEWTFVGANGTAAITASTSATTTITTVPFNTNITLRWTETNGTCSSTDDVVIRNDAQPVAAAGTDQTLCNTSTFTLAGNNPLVGVGTWTKESGSGSITDALLRTSTVTGVTAGLTPAVLRWTIVNGTCSSFDEVSLVNNARQKIKGTFTYYNLANTLLTSQDITVNLYSPSDNGYVTSLGSDVTDLNGYYEIADLCPANDYVIRAISTHATAGSVNGTDAAQVNSWGASPYAVQKVRFFAGNVTGGNLFLNSTDASNILDNFVNAAGFDNDDTWAFWKTDDAISSQTDAAGATCPTVTLAVNNDYTANMYGLCMGDFNRSFNPNLGMTITTSSTLSLINNGNIEVSSNQEFDLPVRLVNNSSVGAVSLILNFPANMVDVQDVVMNNGGQLSWAVNGNELRIGWYSIAPLNLNASDILLTLKLKTKTASNGNSISFTLASDPLNELADGLFDVISNAVLSIDVVNATAQGIVNLNASNGIKLNNQPNPFNGSTTINYTLPFDGKVTLEVYNYMGSLVSTLVNENQLQGNHSVKMDAFSLSAGIYMATLKVKNGNNETVRTIKLVNNH